MIEPRRAAAGALEQLRQRREHARRVAAAGRRLADGEADLALRHREPRDRVDQQQHVAALVAERLGDRHRRLGALDARERGLVGGRDARARSASAPRGRGRGRRTRAPRGRARRRGRSRSRPPRCCGRSCRAASTCRRRSRRRCRGAGRDRTGRARRARGRRAAGAGRSACAAAARAASRRAGGAPRSGRRRRAARRRRSGCRGRPARGPARRRRPAPAARGPAPTTGSPGRMPVSSPSGISIVRPSRKPTTSAITRSRRSLPIRHSSPTSASGPVDSTTEPDHLGDAAHRAVRVGAAAGARRTARATWRSGQSSRVLAEHGCPEPSSWEPIVASTSPPGVRTITPPRCDAPVADQLEVLERPDLRLRARPRRPRSAPGRRGCRRRSARSRTKALRSAPRSTSVTRSGFGVERRPARSSPRRLDREAHHRRLGLREQPRAGVRRPRARRSRRTAAGRRSRARPAPVPSS